MGSMAAYTLKLRTYSPLIISPRSSCAFYKDALLYDDDQAYFELKDRDGVKELRVIYPAYRYGEYELFDPKQADYYIPGSSIKGALRMGGEFGDKSLSLFVDDVANLTHESYQIITPLKSQHLDSVAKINELGCSEPATAIRIPQLLPFFEDTIGIEVMNAGISFNVSIRYARDMDQLLNHAYHTTKEKLGKYLEQLESCKAAVEKLMLHSGNNEQNKEQCQVSADNFSKAIEYTQELYFSQERYLFLGGYKGLIRSLSVSTQTEKSSFFVDQEYRPFGLIQIHGSECVK